MFLLTKKAELLSLNLHEWLISLCESSRILPRLLKSTRIRSYAESNGFYGRVRATAVARRMRPRVTNAISVELVNIRVNRCYRTRNGCSLAIGFIAFAQIEFANLESAAR